MAEPGPRTARARHAIAEGFRVPARLLDRTVLDTAEAVRGWIGSPLAIVLGGSQARGDAVERTLGGRRLVLSDVDLHVVVADDAARRDAEPRVAAGRVAFDRRRRAEGELGPLEIGIHSAAEWSALPARPGTLDLRACGAVLSGDPAWRDRLPRWTPRDVPREEILLLLENRAFELIRAGRTAAGDPVERLVAAHAQYKTALDLATVERLAAGAWEPDAADRVAAARRARVARATIGPDPAWDRALDWRSGWTPGEGEQESDRRAIVDAWVACWTSLVAPGRGLEAVARVAAARARLRRRLRLAFRPEMPAEFAPSLASRLRHALAGTPQHRLNASAGAFLVAESAMRRDPANARDTDARLARLLDHLGAVRPGGRAETADRLLAAWERQVNGATRGETSR